MQKLKLSLKITITFITLFCMSHQLAVAQKIKGFVYELESSQLLRSVTVKNLRTNQETETNLQGQFEIEGEINDFLELKIPGYQTDTAFYYEEAILRVYMLREDNTIVINEVLVTKLTDSRLDVEIEKAKLAGEVVEVSQQQGGLRLSPSRLFGRKSKQARSSLELLLLEKENRSIDRIFTTQLIASLTPVTAEEIPFFRERHRPTISFVKTASPQDMQVYIIDAYKKYKESL